MKTLHNTSEKQKKIYKSNPLHFQIGLTVSLFLIYLALEMGFLVPTANAPVIDTTAPDDITYVTDNYTIEKDKAADKKIEKKKVVLLQPPEIVDDFTSIETTKEFINEPLPSADLDIGTIEYIEPEPDPITLPLDFVEFVPVFPGCESLTDNNARKKCMSERIDQIIKKNFKTYLAERYGLSGVQKIHTQFKINTKGIVTDIKVRSPHTFLEKEAERVIRLIPQMKPGRQQNRNVEVIFTKPITFKIE